MVGNFEQLGCPAIWRGVRCSIMGVLKMKKIASVVATLALAISASGAYAANSLSKGTFGLNVGTGAIDRSTTRPVDDFGFIVNGKYFIQSDLAILGGFGFGARGGDTDKGTDVGLIVGARKYLHVADFAPFVGGRLTYTSTQDATVKTTQIMGEAGAEYFLAKQFSFEGRAGFGYESTEAGGVKNTRFGTTTFGVGFNFYF